MWRVFDTLSSRGFAIPTLRSRWSLSMGLLRFSLFEAAKNQSFIKLEPLAFLSASCPHPCLVVARYACDRNTAPSARNKY